MQQSTPWSTGNPGDGRLARIFIQTYIDAFLNEFNSNTYEPLFAPMTDALRESIMDHKNPAGDTSLTQVLSKYLEKSVATKISEMFIKAGNDEGFRNIVKNFRGPGDAIIYARPMIGAVLRAISKLIESNDNLSDEDAKLIANMPSKLNPNTGNKDIKDLIVNNTPSHFYKEEQIDNFSILLFQLITKPIYSAITQLRQLAASNPQQVLPNPQQVLPNPQQALTNPQRALPNQYYINDFYQALNQTTISGMLLKQMGPNIPFVANIVLNTVIGFMNQIPSIEPDINTYVTMFKKTMKTVKDQNLTYDMDFFTHLIMDLEWPLLHSDYRRWILGIIGILSDEDKKKLREALEITDNMVKDALIKSVLAEIVTSVKVAKEKMDSRIAGQGSSGGGYRRKSRKVLRKKARKTRR